MEVTIDECVVRYDPAAGDAFWVESARGKGSYRRRFSYATAAQAALWFRGINVGHPYRVRLVLARGSGERLVLARKVGL